VHDVRRIPGGETHGHLLHELRERHLLQVDLHVRIAPRRAHEALLLVRFHDFLLVDDVRAETLPRGAEPRPGATYRSFISVAVFCGEESLGMLSVDAPEPSAFDETDLNVMRAMAQLLGAGLVDRP